MAEELWLTCFCGNNILLHLIAGQVAKEKCNVCLREYVVFLHEPDEYIGGEHGKRQGP